MHPTLYPHQWCVYFIIFKHFQTENEKLGMGLWCTSNHHRELKFGTQVKNYISSWFMKSKMTQTSKTSVRNIQRPPSMTLRIEVLSKLHIMLGSWNLTHKWRITYHDGICCQGWPHSSRYKSWTINVLQVWLWGLRVLDTLPIMLEIFIMGINDVKDDSHLQ